MGRISHHLKGRDYKKTHQRKLDEQRSLYLERREKEIREENKKKKIEEAAKPFKSDWRSTLTESEWYAISGSGPTNSTGQTFAYGDPGSGIEVTLSGIGGVEAHPSTVTIDGETYDAPTYNQLSMQGYAKPLGFGVERRTDFQDVNPYLDASQEFAQAVGADYMMNARVKTGYFSYGTLEDHLDTAKYALKSFNAIRNSGMGPEFKMHLKGVIGYEEYGQMEKARQERESSATKDLRDRLEQARRLGKYELMDELQNQINEKLKGAYKGFIDDIEKAYWDEFKSQTGIDIKPEMNPEDIKNVSTSDSPEVSDKNQLKSKIDPEKLNYSSMEDYYNSLPPGVRDDMLKGGKTKDIVSDIVDIAIAYGLKKMLGSDWHMRTLTDKAHKAYEATGVLPKGISAWNPVKAFTPKMLKTLPTKTAWIFGGPVGYTAGMTAYSLASQARDAFFNFIRKKQEEKKVNESTTWNRIKKHLKET